MRRQFSGRKLKLLGYTRQRIPSNWKLYFENLKDPYHATLLHSFLITFGLWRADTQSETLPEISGHSIMVSRNVGRKEGNTGLELARSKDSLQLHDVDTVTPRNEFDDGKVVAAPHFTSVNMHQQAIGRASGMERVCQYV